MCYHTSDYFLFLENFKLTFRPHVWIDINKIVIANFSWTESDCSLFRVVVCQFKELLVVHGPRGQCVADFLSFHSRRVEGWGVGG